MPERGEEETRLVLEGLAVDGAAASARARGVAALDHEVLDDAVEGDAVVVALGGELLEVAARQGRCTREEGSERRRRRDWTEGGGRAGGEHAGKKRMDLDSRFAQPLGSWTGLLGRERLW